MGVGCSVPELGDGAPAGQLSGVGSTAANDAPEKRPFRYARSLQVGRDVLHGGRPEVQRVALFPPGLSLSAPP